MNNGIKAILITSLTLSSAAAFAGCVGSGLLNCAWRRTFNGTGWWVFNSSR